MKDRISISAINNIVTKRERKKEKSEKKSAFAFEGVKRFVFVLIHHGPIDSYSQSGNQL